MFLRVFKTASFGVRDTRRGGIKDQRPKHLGQWKKNIYVLGRCVGGGFWSCCGEKEQIAFPCNPAMRERWKRVQDETDAIDAARAVRRAMVLYPVFPFVQSEVLM